MGHDYLVTIGGPYFGPTQWDSIKFDLYFYSHVVIWYRDKSGYIVGWSKEVLDHVCQEAGITCETVWDKWSNCWNSEAGSHSVGGEGKCEVGSHSVGGG